MRIVVVSVDLMTVAKVLMSAAVMVSFPLSSELLISLLVLSHSLLDRALRLGVGRLRIGLGLTLRLLLVGLWLVSVLIGVAAEDSLLGLGVSLWSGDWLVSILESLFVDFVSVTVTVGSSHAVLIVLLMVKGWRLVVRNMDVVLVDIMSVVMEVMSGIVSVVELLVLPLIVNLVNEERVVVRGVSAWLVVVDIMWVIVISEVSVGLMTVVSGVKVEGVIASIMLVLVRVSVEWLHLENKVA